MAAPQLRPPRAQTGASNEATIASTRTVTVYRNSPTCVKGYKVAGQALALLGQAFQAAEAYPPLVARAAEAGYKKDVAGLNQITRQMDSVNAKVSVVARKIDVLGATFHPSVAGCQ